MLKEMQLKILDQLLPEEKFFEKNETKDDQLIIIGWNMYREELRKKLYIIK